MLDMAGPPSGIITRAITAHSRPIEHHLDSSTWTSRALGTPGPQWPDYFHHERSIDRAYRQRAEHRISEAFDRADELPCVPRTAPLRSVGLEVGFARLPERHHLRRFQRRVCLGGLFGLDRVDAVEQTQAHRLGAHAGLGERAHAQGSEAGHALDPAALETKNPTCSPAGGPGLWRGDLQIQTGDGAIGIAPRCLARLEHALCR